MDISILCVPLNFYLFILTQEKPNFQVEVRDLMHNDYDLSSAFDKVKDVKNNTFSCIYPRRSLWRLEWGKRKK